MNRLFTLGTALCAAAAIGLPLAAQAKLPAPTPEAKATADEAKNKTAWADKVGAYKLCQSQDRVAAHYYKTAGKDTKPTGAPCADPGPYAPTAAASAPPLEAAGAHSPTKTATAPPSSKATAAEQQGTPKK